MMLYISMTRICQLQGPSQALIQTLLGETCFKKTVHMCESGQVHMTNLLNEPELGTKENQLQPIFMYLSSLKINKEQLNAGWKHLPGLYFTHTHKKEKETNIVHSMCALLSILPVTAAKW